VTHSGDSLVSGAPTSCRKRSRHGFTLVSFALNEQDSVLEFLGRAEALLRGLTDDFEMFFVDDGSTDRTLALVQQFAMVRPWLRVISNGENLGTARSLVQVIPLATKDYFFWQTVDWSYDLTCLVDSVGLLERYDVLQGVRGPVFSRQSLGTARSDTPAKAFVSLVNWALVRILFGLPLRDFQNVTVYPTRLLQSLTIESNSAFTGPEMLLKAYWKGAVIKEVPVPFRPRERGEGKGTRPGQILAAVRDILRWWWRWRVLGFRPDHGPGRVVRWEEEAPGTAGRLRPG